MYVCVYVCEECMCVCTCVKDRAMEAQVTGLAPSLSHSLPLSV